MKKIRLTESQLHNVIKESVMNILNEISYGYVKDKLSKAEEDHPERVSQLSGRYDRYHNDDDATYNMLGDQLTFGIQKDENGFYTNKGVTVRPWNRDNLLKDKRTLDDLKGIKTNDPRLANRRAKHLNNYLGKSDYFTGSDLRA